MQENITEIGGVSLGIISRELVEDDSSDNRCQCLPDTGIENFMKRHDHDSGRWPHVEPMKLHYEAA